MRWLKLLGWGLLAYTPILVISIGEHAIEAIRLGQAIPWKQILVGRSLEEYTCAAAVPALFWLSETFPIDRHGWARRIPILVVGALAIAVGKYLLFFPLFFAFWRSYWHMPTAQMPAFIASNALSVTFDFTSVIVVAHAVRYSSGRASASARKRPCACSCRKRNWRRSSRSCIPIFCSTR